MTERVLIEASLDQAEVVRDALDLYGRVAMGQIGEIGTLVSMRRIMIRDDGSPDGCRPATMDEQDAVERHAEAILAVLGHGRGSSFGIGAVGTGAHGKRAYEVQKALDKVLADRRNPGGRTVQHDGIRVRYTQDPLPTVLLTGSPD